MEVRLKPSEIRYCQNSISCSFRGSMGLIGELLDSIYEGRVTIKEIPRIMVALKDGHWYSLDNRRLWVFKQLERLGQCHDIPVIVTSCIPDCKFTANESTGYGTSVIVVGNPGGKWHLI